MFLATKNKRGGEKVYSQKDEGNVQTIEVP